MKKLDACLKNTNISALVYDIRNLGPEAALPNKLPQKWLTSIARDIVTARALEKEHPNDPGLAADRLAPIIAMIMMILEAQNTPSNMLKQLSPVSLEEEDIFEYIEIYKFLVLEELAARTTGTKAGHYSLMTIFQPEEDTPTIQ